MKKYTVIGIKTGVNSGIVRLSDSQASARSHALKVLKDGLYEIILPVEFKKGEEFEWDGEINKTLLEEVAVKKIIQTEEVSINETMKVEEVKISNVRGHKKR